MNRLEVIVAGNGGPDRKTFAEAMADHARLSAWLEERGFPDHLAALEAGETGPEGLQDLLRGQAAHDPKRRAWTRIEAALAGGQLPDGADIHLMTNGE